MVNSIYIFSEGFQVVQYDIFHIAADRGFGFIHQVDNTHQPAMSGSGNIERLAVGKVHPYKEHILIVTLGFTFFLSGSFR